MENPIVFLEIVGSGSNPLRHQIIKISAIGVDTELNERGRFVRYIEFDEDQAESNVLQFNGYDKEVWQRSAVQIRKALKNFSDFLKPYQTIERTNPRGTIHKVRFAGFNLNKYGLPFLLNTVKRENIFIPMEPYGLDVLQLCMALTCFDVITPETNYINDLSGYFGIKLEDDADYAEIQRTYQIAKLCYERYFSRAVSAA